MIILMSKKAYMQVTGCSEWTVRRRIRAKKLIEFEHAGEPGVIYDQDWVELNVPKCNKERTPLWPRMPDVVNAGIQYDTVRAYVTENNKEIKINALPTSCQQVDNKLTTSCQHAPQNMTPKAEALVAVLGGLCESDQNIPKPTGHIRLHRRLLSNHIIQSATNTLVFIELLLTADVAGVVLITNKTVGMMSVGVEEYANSLVSLSDNHGAIEYAVVPGGLSITISKWKTYQPDTGALDNVIVRDMGDPDMEIIPSQEDQQNESSSLSPTPPIYIHTRTPIELDKKEEVEVLSNIGEADIAIEKKEKKRKKKLKVPRDPFNLDDYDPQYRPHVPDAHEIYEYYRDKLKAATSRITAIDLIVPILMRHTKEELISCIDNYWNDCQAKNTPPKYYKRGEGFFNDFYAGYLPGEMPSTMKGAAQERKRKKDPSPDVMIIEVPGMEGDGQ